MRNGTLRTFETAVDWRDVRRLYPYLFVFSAVWHGFVWYVRMTPTSVPGWLARTTEPVFPLWIEGSVDVILVFLLPFVVSYLCAYAFPGIGDLVYLD